MTQAVDLSLSTEKFFESRLKDIEKRLRESFSHIDYGIRVEGYLIYKDVVVDNSPITLVDHGIVEVYVTMKLFEPSEACSDLSYYTGNEINLDQLSEKELEELYNECIESEFEKLNTELALYNKITYSDQDIEIKTEPLECYKDYCEIGGVITAKVNYISPYTLDKLTSVLYHVIELFLM